MRRHNPLHDHPLKPDTKKIKGKAINDEKVNLIPRIDELIGIIEW